jgi:calmodulin
VTHVNIPKTSLLLQSSIKKEFNEKELQDLRTAFELIDSNQDGRINPDEFKIMLKNLGIELEDEKIEELIRSASHAGIEVIDENEFLTWIKQIQELRPESKGEDDGSKELMEAFRVFDLDNNGYITRDELRTAMEKIGEPVTEMQLTEFINLADTDKDGRINYEEFARLLS